MFRAPDGSRRLSLSSLSRNIFSFNDGYNHSNKADPGFIPMAQKDQLFDHQSYLPDPCAWDKDSLHATLIIDNKSVSHQVFRGLQSTGVISQTGMVDTTKIDKNFAHSIAIMPVYRQKQIVETMFWWEEECMRMRKLLDERKEVEELLKTASAQTFPTYRLLLDRVNKKIKTKPSERDEQMERDEDELMVTIQAGTLQAPGEQPFEEIPAYTRR